MWHIKNGYKIFKTLQVKCTFCHFHITHKLCMRGFLHKMKQTKNKDTHLMLPYFWLLYFYSHYAPANINQNDKKE